MKKLTALILCIAITAGALCACGGGEAATNEVRVAYFPNITHAQALYMKDQGIFEKALGDEYSVKWTAFNAGPAEVEALFAGEIDLGYIGPVPAINANVKSHGDVIIIANACDAGAVLLKSADSDIKSVADLDGKKVSVPQLGNTQHLSLLDLLSENGLKPVSEGGTVDIVEVENADVQTMFDNGSISAAIVPEPWGSILEDKCGAKVVLDYDEIMAGGNYPTAVIVVRKDFMEANPEIVKAFVQAHLDATEYINAQSGEAIDIICRQIEEATGKTYEASVIDSAFSRLNITADIAGDALGEFAKVGVSQGFIATEPDEGYVDTGILKSLEQR